MGDENAREPADSTSDVLVKLAGKGPMWLRGLALLALILSAGTPYSQRVFEYYDNVQVNKILQTTTASATAPGIYSSGGTPINAPQGAAALTDSDVLGVKDAEHLSWHTVTLEEHPSFKRLLVDGRKGILAYSVYPSDGCILIKHIRHGNIKTDLVRADISQTATRDHESGEVTKIVSDGGRVDEALGVFSPSLIRVDWGASNTSPVATVASTEAPEPPQEGCLNPHPGQFQYWSQPTADPCWESVFRRFNDGCTHYQGHNKCTNGWDPVVHWTFCAARHY